MNEAGVISHFNSPEFVGIRHGTGQDHASIEQLLVMANIEGMNAEFIHMALPQGDRLKQLNEIAIR